MTTPSSSAVAPPRLDVVELNAYAPRPFVFSELAVCLRDAIRGAGFVCEHRVNETAPGVPAIAFVPTDGWQDFVAARAPHELVLFNMEQLGSDAPWTRDGYAESLLGRVVADYNPSNVDWLRRHNGPAQRVHELPIAPSLAIAYAAGGDDGAPVDVLFFGTLNPRRERVIDALRAAGLSVEVVQGAFAWELAPAVRRARLVLHVHYYETRLFPVARVLQPVAQGVPIVCETSVCSSLADWTRSGIVFAEYDELVPACQALLADPARQLRGVRANLRFAHGIDAAPALHALLADLAALRPGA